MPTLGPGSQGSNYIDRNASSADRTRRNWQRLQNNLDSLKGTVISTGAVPPTAPGNNGDLYIDLSTGELYMFSTTSNSWTPIGNLSGTQALVDKGGLLTHDSANIVELPVGTNGQVLTADSTQTTGLKWAAVPVVSPLTTNGDLYYYNGSNARLPIGTSGQVLTVSAGEPAWSAASPLTTKGDIYIYTTGGTTRLPIGTTGQLLQVVSGLPSWQTVSIPTVPWTTPGDLVYYGGSGPARLPIGTSGQVLTVSAGEPTWAAASPAPLTTNGDLYYYSGGATRLPIGSTGQVLTVTAGEPTWQTPASPSNYAGQSSIVTGFVASTIKTVLTISLPSAFFNTAGRCVRLRIYLTYISGTTSTNTYVVSVCAPGTGTTLATTPPSPAIPSGNTEQDTDINLEVFTVATGSSGVLLAVGSATTQGALSGYGANSNTLNTHYIGSGSGNLTSTTSLVVRVTTAATDSTATARVLGYSIETLT